MNVLTTREDIDICLVIVLCIFTAGIGLLIYLAIYYDKEPNRCIHCKTIVHPVSNEQRDNSSDIESNKMESYQEIKNYKENRSVVEENSKFCSNCGVKLGDREGLKYCAFCGSKIN
jgi:DNA-binding cell septation regulator SpoVG